ncbi:MAG: metallophosphoesterase [Candidatus Fermentibacteraceae bacterium]|nr:metallophosphoesterase [Candidatus Fermentibacteraceae bacterium]
MKLAVTADVHLCRDGAHPERLEALQSILGTIESKAVDTLVVAGDLFDESCSSYSGFEQACRQHPGISVHVIPGNHDPDISDRIIVGDNIHIYQETTVVCMDDLSMVLVPYSGTAGMGEHLEGLGLADRWVLVGHGDYLGGIKERNPYEKGTYMPLYRRDIERYQPWKVFLGHIHQPVLNTNVHYPGSPCGIDINETGRRQFLIFDTATGRVQPEMVDTAVLFFRERFLVIPDDNELERLRNQVSARIATWGLDPGERGKARIRVRAVGYSSDREAVMHCLREMFSDYGFYEGEEPDISSLRVSRDSRRNAIARRTIEFIDELDWDYGGVQPEKEQVIEEALKVIYEEDGH